MKELFQSVKLKNYMLLRSGGFSTELADALQVYGTSVSRWEIGKVRPNEKYIASMLQLVKNKKQIIRSCEERKFCFARIIR